MVNEKIAYVARLIATVVRPAWPGYYFLRCPFAMTAKWASGEFKSSVPETWPISLCFQADSSFTRLQRVLLWIPAPALCQRVLCDPKVLWD